MKTLVLAITIVSSLFLTGCDAVIPLETVSKGNAEVEFLFEHEGVKIYRFRGDNNRYIYFTNTSGKVEWETGGKHSRKVQVLGE